MLKILPQRTVNNHSILSCRGLSLKVGRGTRARGTWDEGRGDVGCGDAGTRRRGDARTSEIGDARGFEDVINK